MNNMGRKVVKGSKTSAPMVMTSTSAGKTSTASTIKPSATKATTTKPSTMPASAPPTREEIARRSYEIFLARGGTDGHDLEDWVQAEHDLSLGA